MELGEKLRRLRMQHGLTQEELALRCDLSKGFISQLERDLTSPSIATLDDILECLGTDLRWFFGEQLQEKIVYGPQDIFESTDADKGTLIGWLIPNAQKNDMEPILIDISPQGSTLRDEPHEGEEFGYVLSGTIHVHIGETHHKARKGESFYYRSTAPHWLSNAGKSTARVVWISSPPSF